MTKEVTSSQPIEGELAGKQFAFEIVLDDQEDQDPYNGSCLIRYERNDGTSSVEKLAFADGKASVILTHGDKAYIYAPGGRSFTITERQQAGWTLTNPATGVFEGTLVPNTPLAVGFTNEYKASAEDRPVSIEVTKQLDGRDMKAEEFNFTIQGRAVGTNGDTTFVDIANGVNTSGKDGVASPIVFGDETGDWSFTYDLDSLAQAVKDGYAVRTLVGGRAQWTLNYRVSELTGELPVGVKAQDPTYYDFSIVVSDNGDGTLEADLANGTAQPFAFNNAFNTSEASLSLKATKAADGFELSDDQFSFVLSGNLQKDNAKYDPTKLVSLVGGTGKSQADGTIVFDKADGKLLTYTIEELERISSGDDAYAKYKGDGTWEVFYVLAEQLNNGMPADGILAQNPSYRAFSVEIQANSDGTLTASFTDDDVKDGLTFTNFKPQKIATVNGDEDQASNAVRVGQVIDYTIAYRNTEASEATVVVTDNVPDHTIFQSATVPDGATVTYYSTKGCVEGSELLKDYRLEEVQSIKWTLSSVSSGQGGTVGFSVKVTEAAVTEGASIVENTGWINVGDNNPAVKTNPTINHVDTAPLTITKKLTGDNMPENAWNTVFSFTVELNAGGEALTGPYVCTVNGMEVGDEVFYKNENAPGYTLKLKAGQTAVISSLPVGATYTVTEQTDDLPLNFSVVTGSVTDTITTTEEASAQLKNVYTVTQPQKTLESPNADGTVGVGDVVTYKITWQNNALDEDGRDVAAPVTVTDLLPTDKLAYVDGTARAFDQDGNAIDGSDVTFTVLDNGNLQWVIDAAAKAQGYVTFDTRVLAAAASIDPVTNKATVNVENGSTVESNPSTTEVVNRTLSITKSVVTDGDLSDVPAATFVFHVKLFQGEQPLTDAFDCVINGEPAGDAFQQPAFNEGEDDPAEYVRVLRLKKDETAVISGLPANARYEITEVDMPQVFKPVENVTQSDDVTMDANGIWTAVEFQNKYTPTTQPQKTVKVDGTEEVPSSANTAQVGDTLEFTVEWINDAIDATTGDAKAATIEITDLLDEQLALVSNSVQVSVEKNGNGTVPVVSEQIVDQAYVWSFEAPANSKGVLTFKATVKEGAQGSDVLNQAGVSVDNKTSVDTTTTTTEVSAATLSLTKLVDGAPEGTEQTVFTFEITLKDKAGNPLIDEYNYSKIGSGAFETGTWGPTGNGTYVVTLANDQTFTFENLPEGATYSIVESDIPGYYPEVTGGSTEGTVNGDVVVAITNQYRSGTVDGATQLSGTKTVVDGYDLSDGYSISAGEFTFVMKATDETRQAIDEGSVIMTGASAEDPYTMITTNGQGEEAVFDWHFGDIQFKKTGTYTFTIEEQQPALSAMDKDPKVIDVTITVTDGENNTFATQVEMGETAAFVNKYTPDPDQLKGDTLIGGTKVLEGEGAIKAGEFTFELVGGDAATVEAIQKGYVELGAGKDSSGAVIEKLETVNGEAGSDPKQATFSFESITFTRPGTYVFKVAEVAGDDANVEYSRAEFIATVTVTDNRAEGRLIASAPVYTPETVEFTNRYSTEPGILDGQLSLAGTKILEGVGQMKPGEFEFVLNPYDQKTIDAVAGHEIVFFNDGAADESLASMVTVNGQGEDESVSAWHFDNIQFKKVGTYVFEIAETQGSDANVTYSTQKYRVTVEVTDDRTGELSAQVVACEAVATTVDSDTQETTESVMPADAMEFVNTYTISSTAKVDVQGTKTLEGRVLKDGEFAFKVEASNQQAIDGVENGTVVINGAEGKQSAIVFNGAPAEGTSTADWMLGQGIKFKAPGTYEFKVTEDSTVKYDPTVTYEEGKSYTFSVKVEDSRTGELTVAETTGLDQQFAFVNKYAPDYNTGEVTIQGIKRLDGRTLQEGEFTFKLTGPKISGSMTATVDANGAFSFMLPTLKATDLNDVTPSADGAREKDFVYTLEEVVPESEQSRQPGVSYNVNNDVYTITVTLTDDGKGNLGFTVGAVNAAGEPVAFGGDSEGADQTGIVFTNSYAPQGSAEVVLKAGKTLVGHTLPQNTFGFELVDENGVKVATGRTTNEAEVPVDENGNARAEVEFTPLAYDKASMADAVQNDDGTRYKTFTYTMYEVDNAMPGVSYDKSSYTVQITVRDDGKGVLTCDAPVYLLNGAQVDALEFVNKYSITDGSFTPEGLMKYTDAYPELTDVSKLAFSFAVYPAGDRTNPVAAGVSGANGAIEFSAIPVTGVGEFDYDIVEDRGATTAGGVTYDGSVYRMHLSVSDNLDGAYLIVPSYYGFDEVGGLVPIDGAPAFTNVYDAADLSVSLDGVTKLVNDGAPEGRTFAFELVDDATGEVVAHGVNDGSGSTHFATLEYNYRKPAAEEPRPEEGEKPAEGQNPAEGEQPGQDQNPAEGENPDSGTTGDGENSGTAEPGVEQPGTEPGGEPGTEPGDDPAGDGNGGDPSDPGTNGDTSGDVQPSDPADEQPVEPVVEPEPSADPMSEEAAEPQGQTLDGGEDLGETSGIATVAYATDEGADVLEYEPVVNPASSADAIKAEGEGAEAPAANPVQPSDPAALVEQPVEAEPISSDLGWHSYTLREVVPQDATQNDDGTYTFRGVTYDPAVYKIHVNVIDNLDGTLRAEVEVWYLNGDFSSQVTASAVQTGENRYSLDLSNVVFRNTYEASVPARVDFMATKALVGRDAMASEFGFVVVDEATGEVRSSGTSAASGAAEGDAAAVQFVPVWYDRVGEHDLWVTEVRGGSTVSGVTYDGTSYRAHVSVVDNGDGTLGASVAYFDANGTPLEGAPAFNNSYKADVATYVELEVSKVIDGRDAVAREFSFAVLGADGTLLAGGQAPALADGQAAGFKLGRVYFSESGEYQLTVVENALVDDTGVTYDSRSFTVGVIVTDQLDGTLAAEVHYPEGGVVFANGYTAKPVEIGLVADKALVGRELAAGEFSFEVVDSKDGAVAAAGTNDADGLVYFDKFKLDAAGSYDFSIREKKGAAKGVTYDEHTYTARVEVADDGLGQLVAEVSYPDGNPRFKNVFTPEKPNKPDDKPVNPGSGGSVPKTADETPAGSVPGALGLLGASLAGAGALLVRKNRRDQGSERH